MPLQQAAAGPALSLRRPVHARPVASRAPAPRLRNSPRTRPSSPSLPACPECQLFLGHSGAPGLGPQARAGKAGKSPARVHGGLGVRRKLALPAGLLPTSPHNTPEPFGDGISPSLEFPDRVASWQLVAPLSVASKLSPVPRPAPSRRQHTGPGLCQPLHLRESALVAVPDSPSPSCLLAPLRVPAGPPGTQPEALFLIKIVCVV